MAFWLVFLLVSGMPFPSSSKAAAALGLAVTLSKSKAIGVGMTLPADMATKPPPVFLRLLHASAGCVPLVDTKRCCPPAGHATALRAFDELVQESLIALSGLQMEPEQWQQVTSGFAQAGLGLCSTQALLSQAHAFAAFLALVGCFARLPGAWFWVLGGPFTECCSSFVWFECSPKLCLPPKLLQPRAQSAHGRGQLGSQLDAATPCVPSGGTNMPAVFNAELRVRFRCLNLARWHTLPQVWCHPGYLWPSLCVCMAGGKSLPGQCLAWLIFFRVWVRLPPPQQPDDVRNARRGPADFFVAAKKHALAFCICVPYTFRSVCAKKICTTPPPLSEPDFLVPWSEWDVVGCGCVVVVVIVIYRNIVLCNVVKCSGR